MSESLTELFRYNVWATESVFDACESLSDAQLDATAVGTFGTIRDTLVHIVGAQERFAAALIEAEQPAVSRERRAPTDLADLRAAARTSGEQLVEVARTTTEGATVQINDRGTEYTMPVWVLLLQALVHGLEHRTQIAAILTQLGIDPPGMDGWTYHETSFDADWSQLWSS
ncbi:MAG: DinB family protein [Thermomicrobiales bacterium]|nr:DinB family protein [Thermomicrobiales bacterium]